MASHVAPAEGSLHDAVQFGETRIAANAQPTPDRWLDAVEQDVKLIDQVGHSRPIISRVPIPLICCSVRASNKPATRIFVRLRGRFRNRQPSIFPGLLVRIAALFAEPVDDDGIGRSRHFRSAFAGRRRKRRRSPGVRELEHRNMDVRRRTKFCRKALGSGRSEVSRYSRRGACSRSDG